MSAPEPSIAGRRPGAVASTLVLVLAVALATAHQLDGTFGDVTVQPV